MSNDGTPAVSSTRVTRGTQVKDLAHVLDSVLELEAESPMRLAFRQDGADSIGDFSSSMSDEDRCWMTTSRRSLKGSSIVEVTIVLGHLFIYLSNF